MVGGGVVGAAAAYFLTRAGCSVTLFERGAICGEASGANAGMIGPSGSEPGVTDHLVRKEPEWFDRLSQDLDHTFEWTQAGRLMLVLEEDDRPAMVAKVAAGAAVGIDCSMVDQDEVLRMVPAFAPDAVVGAGWYPEDGHVNPFLLTHAFLVTAMRLGATVRAGVNVQALRAEGSRVTGLLTSEGEFSCGEVVLAAGAWTAQLCRPLGVGVPVWPGRGQMLLTERLPPLTPIVLRGPVVGFRQTVSGNLLIGSTVEDVGFRKDVTTLLGVFARETVRRLPPLAGARIVRSWAGLRPMSDDGRPLIGPVPQWRGLWLCTGHGRTGVGWSAVSGEILARRLVDGTYDDPQAEALAPAGRLAS